MTFAQRLKKAMVEQGVKQAQLCEMTGISKSGISQYLSGLNIPRPATIKEIALALHIPLEYFTGEIENENGNSNEIHRAVNNLPVQTAAKLMNKSPMFLYQGLQKGVFPFGYAVKMPSGRYSYFISTTEFVKYTGIPVAVV